MTDFPAMKFTALIEPQVSVFGKKSTEQYPIKIRLFNPWIALAAGIISFDKKCMDLTQMQALH
jgi:hypothetical protein